MGDVSHAVELLEAERARLAERLSGIDLALSVLRGPHAPVHVPVTMTVHYKEPSPAQPNVPREKPAKSFDTDLPASLRMGTARRPVTQIAVWRALNASGEPMTPAEVAAGVKKMPNLSGVTGCAVSAALLALKKKGLVHHDAVAQKWSVRVGNIIVGNGLQRPDERIICEACGAEVERVFDAEEHAAVCCKTGASTEVPPEVAKANVARVAASPVAEIAREPTPEPPRKVQSIDIPVVLRREIDNKGTLTLQDAMDLMGASESEVMTHLRALCVRGHAEYVSVDKLWQRPGDDRVLNACREAMPGVEWRRHGKTWAGAATGQVTATLLLEQKDTDGAWGVFLARPGVPTNAGYGVTPGAACRALLSQMPRNGAGNFELKRSLMTRRTQ